MLQVKDLAFKYDEKNNFSFPDFQLEDAGELLILGASGIGKTTLLHLIGGLLQTETGSVDLDGTVITGLKGKKLDQFRGRNIGLVFQQPRFIKALTLRENLELVTFLAGKEHDLDQIDQVLSQLNLSAKLNEKPIRFSQGEQQRAAIAMAMINRPKLILADEPTASLDDQNCTRVLELLRSQAELTGAHLVIITHDQRLKVNFENFIELTA